MKKILFSIFILFICASCIAQSNKWTTLTYNYSAGTVSPEYQYKYTIVINSDGQGTLSYTKASATNEQSFKVGKKGMKKLNNSLKKSKVFTVNPEDMRSSANLVGGPSRNLVITMWQSPMLDSKPPTIEVPSQVNETYRAGINNLYTTIEKLVPSGVWNKATNQW